MDQRNNTHRVTSVYKNHPIEVKPGGYIRRTSTVTIGSMDVPYSMDVETLSGRKTTVDGIWHGVSLYNIQEMQEDIHGLMTKHRKKGRNI